MAGPFNQFAKDQRNSSTQPTPRFWKSYNDFGSGYVDLGVGDYNLLYDHSRGIGDNDIDAIYVPPNYSVIGNTNGRTESQGAKFDFTGTNSNTNEPGIYWNFSQGGVGINDIDILHINQLSDLDETDVEGKATVPYTWDRFRGKCCANALPTGKCGNHVPGIAGSDCNNVFKNCSGIDIKIPYGSNPSYRSQYCAAMATANPTIGDTIKQKYCIANPADPFCACINLTNKPEYIKWAQAMNAKHPEIIISPLMYMDLTGNNPCRKNLTTDMQTQFIPSELIAQIGHLPTSYTISDLTVSGNNNNLNNVSSNVLNDAKKPAAPTPDPLVPDPATDDSTYTMIAFIVIVAIICYVIFGRKAAQQMQPMGMQPMGMQPMGMQPMGMQPMGMQPMGMQPMGMGMQQPMGMQPMGMGMQQSY